MRICLIETCKNTVPKYAIIDGKRRNLQNRQHCFECVPFETYRTRSIAYNQSLNTVCFVCSRPLNPRETRNQKLCGSCITKVRRHCVKLAGIKLLGGECNHCGFKDNPVVLEFHHKNDNKEFTIGRYSNRAWDVVKKEILKCELLCANCHRIHHSNRGSDKFIRVVNDYSGTILKYD